MEPIPNEILSLILSFVHFQKSDWLNVRMTCKRFLQSSIGVFDPSVNDNMALKLAVGKGDVEAVKYLLEDQRVRSGANWSGAPFQTACLLGYPTIASSLLKYDEEHQSVRHGFYLACKAGHTNVVRELLPNVLKCIRQGLTLQCCFDVACTNDHVDVVRELIRLDGVDPDKNQNQALKDACKKGRLELVKILLRECFDPLIDTCPLWLASGGGHLEVIKHLVEDERFDTPERKQSALKNASRMGHVEAVKFFLSHKDVDPCKDNHACVRIAVVNIHFDVVLEYLKDDRVNPIFLYDEMLSIACKIGDARSVQEILDSKKTNPFVFGSRPLLECVLRRDVGMMRILLRNEKIDPTHGDNIAIASCVDIGFFDGLMELSSNRTIQDSLREPKKVKSLRDGHLEIVYSIWRDPSDYSGLLSICSTRGYLNLAEELLEEESLDPGEWGFPLLLISARTGKKWVIKKLLDKGLVDPSTNENEALIVACRERKIESVEMLLGDYRVDPDARGGEALKFACTVGDAGLTKMLLTRANPIFQECTALQLAASACNDGVIEVLLRDERITRIHYGPRTETAECREHQALSLHENEKSLKRSSEEDGSDGLGSTGKKLRTSNVME
jgi:ankyrin repeat protein